MGARVAGPDRFVPGKSEFGSILVEDGYPPDTSRLGPGAEFAGFQARDDEGGRTQGYELFLGYRVTGEGQTRQSGVELKYEHAGKGRTVLFETELLVCTGPATTRCEAQE